MYLKGHLLIQFHISKVVFGNRQRKITANSFTNIIKQNRKTRFIDYFLQQDAFEFDGMAP